MSICPTKKEKKIISDNMVILKGTRNPFMKISELLEHKYNPRQLCHYWRNNLDPELCHDPLDDDDKQFIDKWILDNRIGEGEIKWKTLRLDLKYKTGRLRSENYVKNYWYSKQRRQGTPGVSKMKGRQRATEVSDKMRILNILNH